MGSDPLSAGNAPGLPASNEGPGPGLGPAVLILDHEPGMRSFLQRGLAHHFALVEVAADAAEAQELLRRCHFDLLIADIRLPDRSGLTWVQELRDQGSNIDVIFTSADADLDTAIGALRAGACDFILKPFRIEQFFAAVERTAERLKLSRENYVLHWETKHHPGLEGIIGNCERMKDVCTLIHRIAPMRSTMLIHGESGTGKELAARAIHDHSGRQGSFVAINCGAMSPDLLESELFGHVKGAFTGAHQAREGLFSFAHGGSLFLDEIGEMPLAMQAKLLRVLDGMTIRPVGGNQEVPVDVRIIAATNRDLAAEVDTGRFREDLYYRLDVVSVRLPPLRERRDDIPALTRFFLDRLCGELGMPQPKLDDWDLDRLCSYDWPGNVRELRNVIERCLLLGRRLGQCVTTGGTPAEGRVDTEPDLSLDAVERGHILTVLEAAEGNKSEAARRLGISRKTLERKVQAWGRSAG